MKNNENANLLPIACKSSDKNYKARRWHIEPEDEFLTAFLVDTSRILYSSAFRRLKTKNHVSFQLVKEY